MKKVQELREAGRGKVVVDLDLEGRGVRDVTGDALARDIQRVHLGELDGVPATEQPHSTELFVNKSIAVRPVYVGDSSFPRRRGGGAQKTSRKPRLVVDPESVIGF